MWLGCTDVVQEVLWQQPKHLFEGSFLKLSRVHPFPPNPGQRVNAWNQPSWYDAIAVNETHALSHIQANVHYWYGDDICVICARICRSMVSCTQAQWMTFVNFSQGLVPDHLIMNALAYQADPTCVDPAKLSPTPQRGCRRRSQARSMSVQSSLDPYGSSTTLNSESASSEIESSPRLSSDGSRGSPLGRLSNWKFVRN